MSSVQLSPVPESTVRGAPRAPLAADAPRLDRAWDLLHDVLDPEVPALSVIDLGIVRAVRELDDDARTLEVDLTPTYSGCPATEAIERSVIDALEAAGLGPVHARTVLSPAWTSDWISEDGLRKLREYGIAPPGRCGSHAAMPSGDSVIRIVPRAAKAAAAFACPRCGSSETERLSAFGATACKALYRCRTCREPFEAFKAI